MIQKNEPLSSEDFSKGLVTRSDILKADPKQSPNCMDVKWYFDGAIGKRFGASSTNTIAIGSTPGAAWVLDTNSSLTTSLISYWKLDESSNTRFDERNIANLTDFDGVLSISGIRGQAANFVLANSQSLYYSISNAFGISNQNFSFALWLYLNTFGGVDQNIFVKRDGSNLEFDLIYSNATNGLVFRVSTDGANYPETVFATSFGTLTTATWYNIVCWQNTLSHIGISVNRSVNTANFTNNVVFGTAGLCVSGVLSSGSPILATQGVDGRVDEIGFWKKMLTAQERQDLYGNGSGNTFTSAGNSGYGWAMFDFGATNLRWLTVSAGTGIMASSNLGTTFITISTNRTQNYQYLDRSKNVLIATSEAQDPPLYWAGSTGTFASALAVGSAPNVKYNINYQGFLILLNSATRKRGFFYADENLQLTDPWTNSFDFPSSADDEITAAFVLYKFLYVSTRYKLFRVAFVGGNPDWTFLKVKDWGFVPRTAKLMTIKGGQVVVGLDWQRRLRVFDGYDDLFISDNVENNNGINEFSMTKISYAGSGLIISHAEADLIEQEYRLNVAVGLQSSQTTHAIVLNGRSLALYPYSNQNYQAMCIAESNNQQHLMAVDRSGFVYILNSGNLDVSKPISEFYDSPPLFKSIPGTVSKSQNNTLYFKSDSCGQIFYQDALNRSTIFGPVRQLINLLGNENVLQVEASVDIPATYNTYEFRILSSGNTANPWKMTHWDFLQETKGIGKG